MRLKQILPFLGPLLVRARSVPHPEPADVEVPDDVYVTRLEPPSTAQDGPQISSAFVVSPDLHEFNYMWRDLDFPLEIVHEELPEGRSFFSCNDQVLRVAGVPLLPLQVVDRWVSSTAIPFTTRNTHTDHTLLLNGYANCETEGSPLKSLVLSIKALDGHVFDNPQELHITVNPRNGQLLRAETFPTEDTENEIDFPLQATDAWAAEDEDEHEDEALDLIEEVKRLRFLEESLEKIQEEIERQQEVVSSLTDKEHSETRERLSNCNGPKCFFKTVFHGIKHCVHILVVKLAPTKPKYQYLSAHDRHAGAFAQSSFRGPATPPQHCSYAGRPVSHSDRVVEIDVLSLKIYMLFAATGSFFLLTLVFMLLHKCCSPRARAERRARQEERRTAREYRCLARRKAWQDWWNERFRRRTRPARGSYDEKRALIASQEGVLEDAMQAEIDRLCADHERRIPRRTYRPHSRRSSGGSSLPTYQSNSSTGRPPSYREVDSDGSSSAARRSRRRVFTPPMTDFTPDDASDVTPESSIADLSPRHSSETLRTEASLAASV